MSTPSVSTSPKMSPTSPDMADEMDDEPDEPDGIAGPPDMADERSRSRIFDEMDDDEPNEIVGAPGRCRAAPIFFLK